MESKLIDPTLHIEVETAKASKVTPEQQSQLRGEVTRTLTSCYATVQLGPLNGFESIKHVLSVHVADFTGPKSETGWYDVALTSLDVQTYSLRTGSEVSERRSIKQPTDEMPQARVLALPNVALKGEWDSLVFDDALPSRILRYLVRMMGMMGQPGLDLATFNWNRLCLLHGPPGSGKSTLCRALAQKLSIRLGQVFLTGQLVEVNANAMLSKYFGESGKTIESTFEKIRTMAEDRKKLVVVVIDEVETIAGSRQRASDSGECNDGLRATNQLLTALDRLRKLSNVIVCCTSNLIEAIDPAFLDRVDIKQHVPSPSPSAIYNIFRSCLNELVRSSLVDTTDIEVPAKTPVNSSPAKDRPAAAKRRKTSTKTPQTPSESTTSSSDPLPEGFTMLSAPQVPSLATTQMTLLDQPQSPGYRIWALSEKCKGLSGRTLRRLPILGLAMYTWGGKLTLDDAVEALEKAVEQEVMAGTAGKA